MLSATKEKLRLDLDIQNFENQCFSVNVLLNKYGLFLKVYKLKDKFCYSIQQDYEKKKIARELSNCIVEKFNRFNTARVEFGKKLRQSFRPIDIIYKPVKKYDEIMNCYFSEKLNAAFRIMKVQKSNIVHLGNVVIAQIITVERTNLIVILRIVLVIQDVSIILINNAS